MAEEKVIEHIPMLLNLGDWGTSESVIGYASAFRDSETSTARIEIHLGKDASDILENLQEIVDLKAIGFVGIMKRPANGG
jgi:hypothetical protein